LVETGIPLVSADRRIQDLDVGRVTVDNKGASSEVVIHPLGNGHWRQTGADRGRAAEIYELGSRAVAR
jgi:DNA-binding LacI/PurR family transcriptional regulator